MLSLIGTQPALLPNIEVDDGTLDDDGGPLTADPLRKQHRVRELSVKAMVETTAIARAKQALTSKTRRSAHSEQYEVDDKVEVSRAPAAKDITGWRGDCDILKVEDDGTIIVKWQGGTLTCRPQDVRRSLLYHIVRIFSSNMMVTLRLHGKR